MTGSTIEKNNEVEKNLFRLMYERNYMDALKLIEQIGNQSVDSSLPFKM